MESKYIFVVFGGIPWPNMVVLPNNITNKNEFENKLNSVENLDNISTKLDKISFISFFVVDLTNPLRIEFLSDPNLVIPDDVEKYDSYKAFCDSRKW